ncbi:MAG: nuclear transport factor 2 family protein [Pyrinomonadaceae bacterium]
MKKAIFIAFTIALLTFSAFGQKAVKADPKKAVNAAFDRLVEGIKQVDLDKVMAAYEKSDRLLIFNNNGSATIGWENVRSVNEKIYARLSNVSLEITGLRVEMLSANTAYVSSKWKQTQENDGKLESASGRMTLVYKLIGKEWKVVHRHTSPDNPDATRPVFPSERTN